MSISIPRAAVLAVEPDRRQAIERDCRAAGIDVGGLAVATNAGSAEIPDASTENAPDHRRGAVAVLGEFDLLVIDGCESRATDELRRLANCGRETPILAVGGQRTDVDASLADTVAPQTLLAVSRLLAEIRELRMQQSQLLRSQRRLADWALRDPVTGLPNRRAWEQAIRHGDGAAASPRCVVMFDVDRFKLVNDRFGHEMGDRMLRLIGQSLAASIRASDPIARIGGDEFAVLLSDCPVERAAAVVERIRTFAAQPSPEGAGRDLRRVTMSAGYCCMPAGGEGLLAAVQAADAALQRAKAAGRDRSEGDSEPAAPPTG